MQYEDEQKMAMTSGPTPRVSDAIVQLWPRRARGRRLREDYLAYAGEGKGARSSEDPKISEEPEASQSLTPTGQSGEERGAEGSLRGLPEEAQSLTPTSQRPAKPPNR
jgi:hypothetical protein